MLIRVLLDDVDEVVLYRDNDTELCSLLSEEIADRRYLSRNGPFSSGVKSEH